MVTSQAPRSIQKFTRASTSAGGTSLPNFRDLAVTYALNSTDIQFRPKINLRATDHSTDPNTVLDGDNAAISTESPGHTEGTKSVGNDQLSSSHHHCSDDHVVHKQFLEPLCDNCLLKELKSNTSPAAESSQDEICTGLPGEIPAHRSRIDLLVDEKLKSLSSLEESVVSKEDGVSVTAIEHAETPKKHTLRSRLSFINSQPLSSLARNQNHTGRPDSKEVQAASSVHSSSPSTTSLSSDDSLVPRGRKGDQAKALRRRAINLSRDDLRISSRWSSDEQQSMSNFRDALLETAKDKSQRVFSRFIKKEQKDLVANVEKKTGLVGGIRRSISMINLKEAMIRSRSVLKLDLSRSHEDVTPKDAPTLGFRMTSRHEAIRNRYYNEKQAKENAHSTEIVEKEITDHGESDDDNVSEPARVLSWEEHLRHDLAKPHRPTHLATIIECDVEEDRDEPPVQAQLPEKKMPLLTKADVCFTVYDPACYPTTTPTVDFVNLRNNPSDLVPRLRYVSSQIPLLTKSEICFTTGAPCFPSGAANDRVSMLSGGGNPPYRLEYGRDASRENTILSVVFPSAITSGRLAVIKEEEEE